MLYSSLQPMNSRPDEWDGGWQTDEIRKTDDPGNIISDPNTAVLSIRAVCLTHDLDII